ncbi:MAG: tetratricopeptide repeat protein [Succinivibrionaceae bacterium]
MNKGLVSILCTSFLVMFLLADNVSYGEDFDEVSRTVQDIESLNDFNMTTMGEHIYTIEEINSWVETGSQLSVLSQVHGCQFTDDIRHRAMRSLSSSYEFLYGDMLVNGVCVDKDISSGVFYIQEAAKKGYPGAMRRLSFYYEVGRYVQQDKDKATLLMHEAALMGYVPAQIDWVSMLIRGMGSAVDYEEAYSLLHHSLVATPIQFDKSKKYLEELATRMPDYIVERAKTKVFY